MNTLSMNGARAVCAERKEHALVYGLNLSLFSRPPGWAPPSAARRRHPNRPTIKRTPIHLQHRFQSCISLLLAACLLVYPLLQELNAHPLVVSKMGVSFQIAPPAAPTHKGFLGGIGGTWNVQPKLQNSIPSISGQLGFSLTASSSASLTSTPSQLKLSILQITGAPMQTTGLTTGKIHILLNGSNKAIGQGTPLSGTAPSPQVSLGADFNALFGMDSSQQSFAVPMRLDATLNTATGLVSGTVHGQLPSAVPLLGGTTITMNITAAPLPRAEMVPNAGLTRSGTYTKSSAGRHTNIVNMLTGNLNVDPVDLSLPVPGRTLSVVLERYYNSRGGYGYFGYGWRTLLDTSLQYCGSSGCLDGPIQGSEALTTHRYIDPSGATFFIDYEPSFGCQTCRAPGLSATLIDQYTLLYDNGMTLRFSASGQLSAVQDRNGNTITIKWNAAGRPSEIDDPLNRVITITSNPNNTGGNISSISPPDPLASITYSYDGSSHLTTVTKGSLITQYGYGNYGDGLVLTSITDPAGYKTAFTYLPYAPAHPECGNQLASIGYTKDQTNTTFDTYTYTSCTFDKNGNAQGLSTVTDPNGHTTTYSWDPNSWMPVPDMTITDARGVRSISYDEYSFKSSSWRNALRTGAYDYNGETLSTVTTTFTGGANSLTTTYSYPSASCFNSNYSLNTSCYLNSLLPATRTDPDGHTTTFGYDHNGNLQTVTDALGQVTTLNYNPDGTLGSLQRPRGINTLAYHYDGTGAVIVSTADALGRVSYNNFDSAGRLQFARSAAGEVTQFTYDGLGRLVDLHRAANGSDVVFVYDPDGNIVRLTAKSPGSTDRDTIFTYDSRDRVVSKRMADALGSIATFQYDGVGNLASKTLTGSPANTVKYTYDAVNRLFTLTEPSGNVVTFGSYDANDRPAKVTYQNGGMVINRQWDGLARLTGIKAVTSSGNTLVDLKYQYAFTPQNSGTAVESPRLHSMTDTNGVTTQYSYDPDGQLLSATTGPAGGRFWTYDPNGNRSTQTMGAADRSTVTNYTYDQADELSNTAQPAGIGSANGYVGYTYDLKGNLLSRSDGMALAYDAANTTISAKPAGGSGAAIKMSYDNSDQMERTAVQSASQGISTFLYDGKSIGPTSSQGPSGQTYFSRTPGGALVSMKRGGSTFYYITDRLGSVVAMTALDSASKQAVIVNQYQNGPWGEVVSQTERVDAQQPFRFIGAEYDASLGLYKMGARYYDPAAGRFTQLDPLGGGYRYSSNDPINRIDEAGLQDNKLDLSAPPPPEPKPWLPSASTTSAPDSPDGGSPQIPPDDSCGDTRVAGCAGSDPEHLTDSGKPDDDKDNNTIVFLLRLFIW